LLRVKPVAALKIVGEVIEGHLSTS